MRIISIKLFYEIKEAVVARYQSLEPVKAKTKSKVKLGQKKNENVP